MALKPPRDPLIAIVGATGTGKSKLAVELAQRFNGEIINGDAMQMYKGLPIITNKIRRDEMKGIPHHLLDCVDLSDDPWTVSTFVKEGQKIIRGIRSRGRLPILVGGTHFYTQSLLFSQSLLDEKENLEPNGDAKPSMAEDMSVLDASAEDMLAKLKEVDPEMADRWHPKDHRKIRRSLEIWLKSGRKASDLYKEQKERAAEGSGDFKGSNDMEALSTRCSTLIFWLYATPERLRSRLDTRVDDMVQSGLIDEAQEMHDYLRAEEEKGRAVDRTRGVWVAIGFKELEGYLKNREDSSVSAKERKRILEEAVEVVKIHTRQYAKQQERWIRLKLLRAANEANTTKRTFLLDGTDLSKWEEDVEQATGKVGEAFLGGAECPDPQSLSEVAHDILSVNEQKISSLHDAERLRCHSCDVCDVVVVGEEHWQNHLTSRRHKKTIQAQRKMGVSGLQSENQLTRGLAVVSS